MAQIISGVSILLLYSVMWHTVMSEVIFTGVNCIVNCTILWCAVGKLVCPLWVPAQMWLCPINIVNCFQLGMLKFSLCSPIPAVVGHESSLEHWSVPAVGITATVWNQVANARQEKYLKAFCQWLLISQQHAQLTTTCRQRQLIEAFMAVKSYNVDQWCCGKAASSDTVLSCRSEGMSDLLEEASPMVLLEKLALSLVQ